MRRASLWMRRHWIWTTVLILTIAGSVYAGRTYTMGVAATSDTSPGASTFNTMIVINTALPAGPPTPTQGNFGDTIYAIEVGRDDRGPFAAIVWSPGGNSPHALPWGMHPAYLPSWFGVPGQIPQLNAFPPESDLGGSGTTPPPGAGGDRSYSGHNAIKYRFVYRPNNDPASPGWTSLPGAAGQIEWGLQACRDFADLVRQYMLDVAAGTFYVPAGGGPVAVTGQVPSILLEVDFDPTSATFLEFYKFRIMTRP